MNNIGHPAVTDKLGRVLIVTAAQEETRILRRHLIGRFDLALAGSGAQALRILGDSQEIDLALIAGSLPDMTDVQLVRAIREAHSANRLPVIMLAEENRPEDVTLAFQSGADNCLTRPFTPSGLTARVEALLKVKRRFDEAQKTTAVLKAMEAHRLDVCRMLSHDLRSPLSNISLAEGILRRSARDDQVEVKHSLKVIRLMVESMGQVITNHLDLLQLNSGEMRIELKPTGLRDVIVNVVSQLELAAQKKRIKLNVASTEGLVMADGGRLVQVLGNLVSNAIKYSPHNSEVKIWTSVNPEFCSVFVQDEGPGIPPEDRSSLFREFGTVSTHPTGGESRTGLGLWIVKKLVEAQEGVVGADFPKAGGSRFWIGLRKVADRQSDDALASSM